MLQIFWSAKLPPPDNSEHETPVMQLLQCPSVGVPSCVSRRAAAMTPESNGSTGSARSDRHSPIVAPVTAAHSSAAAKIASLITSLSRGDTKKHRKQGVSLLHSTSIS